MMAALYLQVSVVSQALIFVTRSRGISYFERPGLLLVTAFMIAQLVREQTLHFHVTKSQNRYSLLIMKSRFLIRWPLSLLCMQTGALQGSRAWDGAGVVFFGSTASSSISLSTSSSLPFVMSWVEKHGSVYLKPRYVGCSVLPTPLTQYAAGFLTQIKKD